MLIDAFILEAVELSSGNAHTTMVIPEMHIPTTELSNNNETPMTTSGFSDYTIASMQNEKLQQFTDLALRDSFAIWMNSAGARVGILEAKPRSHNSGNNTV